MKVLYLGPARDDMAQVITRNGDFLLQTEETLGLSDKIFEDTDFIVSFGYRHIISLEVLLRYPFRAINLHVSFLPWNRGADPNLWSFLEDTPKGVSIHLIDPGVDTGAILAQQEVLADPCDTLRTSYDRLTRSIVELFTIHWPSIRVGESTASQQSSTGSYHRLKDKEPFLSLLHAGWDTPVKDILGKARKGSIHA
ncbi:MAG: formyltransferase family protein [Sterolibacterium sp.]|nr:formyltransferase family protein [Sterolibacterium sp.]